MRGVIRIRNRCEWKTPEDIGLRMKKVRDHNGCNNRCER